MGNSLAWCLRRMGRLVPAPVEPVRSWRWELRNELTALTGFNEQVQTLFSTAAEPRPDPATISSVQLILDELLTNVIKYAHPGEVPGHRLMDVLLGLEKDTIKLYIEDDGIPFDPTVDISRGEAEADLELEERSIGGWGLSLVRKTADGMHYQRVGNRNQLTLYKRFPAAQISPV